MGGTGGLNTVLLLDNYGEESRLLHQSFKAAGYRGKVVVINDDGFLPEDVISLYRYFLGPVKGQNNVPGIPRFFNQIELPDYWEIDATASQGKVMDLSVQRGTIFYADFPEKRLVKVVDWTDEKGVVRSSDHYDCYGMLYARTAFNKNAQRFCKTYYDAKGREIIVENYVTHDIILNRNSKIYVFSSKTELVQKLFEEAHIRHDRVFFNSLSTPFFVSEVFAAPGKNDVLFWQENKRDDIPGNMQMILDRKTAATQIYVQKRESYDALIGLGADASMVKPLGYIYQFEKDNRHGNQILICTNSDQIAKLEYLVNSLPDMLFHIAAVTEMSSSLLSMARHDNVRVYPNIKDSVCTELFETCDYYLDINYYSEILSAVKRAFKYNMLILAFRDTVHNKAYTANEHVFESAEAMAELLKKTKDSVQELDQHLLMQKQHAMAEEVAAYQRIIG